RTLYDSVTAGRPVDLAVTLARQAVLAASEGEWATPVLYLRAVDGVLFDLEARTEAPPKPAATVPAATVPAVTVPAAALPIARPPERAAPSPGPPAQPQHVRAEVVDGVVNLMWRQPPDHSVPVRAWEVWRNGVRHAIVTLPMALDDTPGPGEYSYSVVALGDDEMRSAHSHTCTTYVTKPVRRAAPAVMPPPRTAPVPARQAPLPLVQPARKKSRAGWILLILAIVAGFAAWSFLRPGTTPSHTGVVTPPNVTTDVPVAEPDLVLSQSPPGQGGGSSETTLDYSVSNTGTGRATNAYVEVTIDGAGALISATVTPPGANSAQPCAIVTDQRAKCWVGTQEVGAVSEVAILMRSESPPPTINVLAVSDESDRNPDDNAIPFTLPSP
ncbi:MAG TPA: hypothetical protein VFL38_13110, partial [Humibacillus xanthopallidus]|nr:hypothetical protein [Humibacillus xanthopallidus]